MEPNTTAAVVRSRPWKRAAGGLLAGVAFAFHPAMIDMVEVWASKADYSHGFLVPPVAAYLLWTRRDRIPPVVFWPDALGLLPILIGLAISIYGGVTNKGKEFLQGSGLILALATHYRPLLEAPLVDVRFIGLRAKELTVLWISLAGAVLYPALLFAFGGVTLAEVRAAFRRRTGDVAAPAADLP